MEPFDFKAVRATVCNAGKFLRPLAICLRIYYSFMYAICVFALVCVCVRMKEGGKEMEKERRGLRVGGGLLMIIWEWVCVTEFVPT